MKPQFIIIAILITLKVIGVASRAKADTVYFACNSETEFQLINTYTNPTYRCGDSPSFKRI
jgi:hypothetical protein|tara:strand:+ start:389 stop:571 length:183 start_codon:yes stop_codon:yes gene_type:complete